MRIEYENVFNMIRLCSLVELVNYLNIAKLKRIYTEMRMVRLLSIDVGLIVLLMLFQNGIALIVGGISDRQEVRDV